MGYPTNPEVQSLQTAMYGAIDSAQNADLQDWQNEIRGEMRAPSLRTLAWDRRRERLETRDQQIASELKRRVEE